MKDVKTSWIVLCATQRSGSTMVCDDLNRHGLGYPEERFLGIVQGVKDGNFDRLQQRFHRIANQCCNKKTKVSSVKIMANYADELNIALDKYYELDEPSKNWASIARFFEGATFLMLHRGNGLDQALSRVVSRKTGINHLVESKNSEFVPGNASDSLSENHGVHAKITMAELGYEVHGVAIENQMWSIFFARNRITPHYLHYEQCAQSTNYLTQIADKVSHALPEGVRDRNLKKLPTKEVEPLATLLVRTRYPDFFKEADSS